MISATHHADETVRAAAMFYLAEHGDRTMRGWFVSGLESPLQQIREAAIMGIRRFGTASEFASIRRLFDLPGRPDVHGYLPSALEALTFLPYNHHRGPEEWDDWYAEHRTTRVDWARDALRRTDEESRRWPFSAAPQRNALVYLAERRDASDRHDFERAAPSTRFAVRIEAARVIATYDKGRATRLLVRELTGRFHGACDATNRALNELTGQSRTVDCRNPRARAKAAAEWIR